MQPQPGDLVTVDNIQHLGPGSIVEFGLEGAKVQVTKIRHDYWKSENGIPWSDEEMHEKVSPYPCTVVSVVAPAEDK